MWTTSQHALKCMWASNFIVDLINLSILKIPPRTLIMFRNNKIVSSTELWTIHIKLSHIKVSILYGLVVAAMIHLKFRFWAKMQFNSIEQMPINPTQNATFLMYLTMRWKDINFKTFFIWTMKDLKYSMNRINFLLLSSIFNTSWFW